eukprot:7489729-Pyramimonas_sp.AAC.1
MASSRWHCSGRRAASAARHSASEGGPAAGGMSTYQASSCATHGFRTRDQAAARGRAASSTTAGLSAFLQL